MLLEPSSSHTSALPRKSPAGAAVLKRSQSAPQLNAALLQMLAELGAQGGTRLTDEEEKVLQELRSRKPDQPYDMVLFTDPNKDPDDVATYVMCKQLQVDGFVRLSDVAVTLGDASVREKRARFAKGVFNHMGLPEVRVSHGQDYPMTEKQAKDHATFLEQGNDLLAKTDELHGNSLPALEERLKQAKQRVKLVVIAGMTDADALVYRYPELVRKKVETITIMGGVEPDKDADGYVQPDARAYNNTTDLEAARRFYRSAQALKIPLCIVTKQAAYKAPVTPSFYESLAKSGDLVGKYLDNVQENALSKLWGSINAGLMPPRMDNAWFFETFTSEKPPQTTSAQDDATHAITFDKIWPKVDKLNLYDPLTLLAAVPGAAGMLFTPRQIQTRGLSVVEHVGGEEVTHPEKAKLLMSALAKVALASK
ncbi:nucleoside hydrolase [Xanthomonas campestris pv. asclepiadis]|nr:nucleoside hydrolase [Xanthomonas campestris pv. asclepiadis]